MKKRRQSAFGIVGVAVLFFAVISVPTLATVAAEIATAESATATRTLPAEPISAGEFFSVRIEAAGYGAFGQVVETLPAGFKYVQSSLNPGSVEVVGDTVRFYLLGDTSFNYTLTAPHTEGTYSFSGLLKDEDKNEYEVGGDTEVVVEAATAVATRTLPAEPVSAGKFFSVRIETAGYGSFGQVLETLPEGFMYLTSTLDPGSVVIEAETNTVKFTLFGDTSFNYTAIAPKTEGTYTFSGKLKDTDKKEYEVGGDTEVVVEKEEEEAVATRTLPAESVPLSAFFTVGIEAEGYGYFGKVVETLPEGFMYLSSSLNPESVKVVGETVEFELCGEPSFTYTVIASDTEGIYNFSGTLVDEDKNEYEVGGDTELEVEEKEEEKPTATRTLPTEAVPPSANFTVGVEASDYGVFGRVIETLPDGFVYLTSTLDPGSVVFEAETNTVKFTLFGDTSFNYTVTAAETEGTYTFSGLLVDEDKKEYEVGGATELVVEEEAAEPTVSIATDKKNYTTGETMELTVGLKNPAETAEQVVFAWGVNFTDYGNAFFWLTAFVLTLPPESNQSFQIPLEVGDWGPARFNAAWHVALFDFDGETYELSEDRADWSFVPALELGLGSESEMRPAKVAEEIGKEVTKVEANL